MSLISSYYPSTFQDADVERAVMESKYSAVKRARAKVVPQRNRDCPEMTRISKKVLKQILGCSFVRYRDRDNRFLIFATRKQLAL